MHGHLQAAAARDAAGNAAQYAKDTTGSAAQYAKHTAKQTKDSAGKTAERAQDAASDAYNKVCHLLQVLCVSVRVCMFGIVVSYLCHIAGQRGWRRHGREGQENRKGNIQQGN